MAQSESERWRGQWQGWAREEGRRGEWGAEQGVCGRVGGHRAADGVGGDWAADVGAVGHRGVADNHGGVADDCGRGQNWRWSGQQGGVQSWSGGQEWGVQGWRGQWQWASSERQWRGGQWSSGEGCRRGEQTGACAGNGSQNGQGNKVALANRLGRSFEFSGQVRL